MPGLDPAGRRRDSGGLCLRAAIDAFLDIAAIKTSPNTLRAYAGVLDRVAELIGPGRALAEVDGDELGDALTTLWGQAAPATFNRNRAALGSWLAWCAHKRQWTHTTAAGIARASPRTPGQHESRLSFPD